MKNTTASANSRCSTNRNFGSIGNQISSNQQTQKGEWVVNTVQKATSHNPRYEFRPQKEVGKMPQYVGSSINQSMQGPIRNNAVTPQYAMYRKPQRLVNSRRNTQKNTYVTNRSPPRFINAPTIRVQRPTDERLPMLTVLLLRLEEKIDIYCKILAHPTSENIISVAKLLDVSTLRKDLGSPKSTAQNNDDESANTNYTKSSSSNLSFLSQSPFSKSSPNQRNQNNSSSFSSNSPSTTKQSFKNSLSPRSLRLLKDIASSLSWSPSGNTDTDGAGKMNSGQQALATEWKKFVSPLLLFAGAENLFSCLEHVFVESHEKVDNHSRTKPKNGSGSEMNDCTPQETCSICFGGVVTTLLSKPKSGVFLEQVAVGTKIEEELNDIGGNNFKPQKIDYMNEKERENNIIKIKKLVTMYKHVAEELTLVKEVLCDPILRVSMDSPRMGGMKHKGEIFRKRNSSQHLKEVERNKGHNTGQPSKAKKKDQSQKSIHQAALIISKTFNSILSIVSARCKLISIHADLFFSRGSPKNDSFSSLLSENTLSENNLRSGNEDDDYTEPRPEFLLQVSQRCHALLTSLPSTTKVNNYDGSQNDCIITQCGAALPMVNAVKHEIKAILAALTACQSVNQCRFYETIMLVRKLKVHLGPSSPFYYTPPSPLHVWLHTILSSIISKMSVYFDRIEAYSDHMYNFRNPESFGPKLDISRAPEDSLQSHHSDKLQGKNLNHGDNYLIPLEDYDGKVLDLLRRHESKGGSLLAVAVILDVEVGIKPYFERGYICNHSSVAKTSAVKPDIKPDFGASETEDAVDGLKSWPAIYLRTTRSLESVREINDNLHQFRQGYNNWSGSNGRSGARRRNVPKLHFSTGYLSPSRKSQPTKTGSHPLLQSHKESKDITEEAPAQTNFKHHASIQRTHIDSLGKIAEYWPEDVKLSWPLAEWPNIISVLIQKKEEPIYENLSNGGGMSLTNITRDAFMHRDSNNKSESFGISGSPIEALNSKHFAQDNPQQKKNSFLLSLDKKKNRTMELISQNHIEPCSTTNDTYPAVTNPSIINERVSSVYHVSQIDAQSWIIVISKDEEEKKTRRTKGLTDSEINLFLEEMSSKLRSDYLFSSVAIAKARSESLKLSQKTLPEADQGPRHTLKNFWGRIGNLHIEQNELLVKIKNMIGSNKNAENAAWPQFLPADTNKY